MSTPEMTVRFVLVPTSDPREESADLASERAWSLSDSGDDLAAAQAHGAAIAAYWTCDARHISDCQAHAVQAERHLDRLPIVQSDPRPRVLYAEDKAALEVYDLPRGPADRYLSATEIAAIFTAR